MRICIVFGHYNTRDSFNASVRDTFIDEAKKIGKLQKREILILRKESHENLYSLWSL